MSRDKQQEETYEPCMCCGKTDMNTGNGMCGFGYECDLCLLYELTGKNSRRHKKRHK